MLETSAVTGEGIDSLRTLCKGGVSLFSGESGVGKSSLLKAMDPSISPLKTPLTVILANNNILLAHPDDLIKNQNKWLASTQEEAQHMGNLINDMLFLAKSDEGNPLVLADVNFSDICESDVLQFEPVAFERGLTLGSSVEPGIILRGDNTQLNQLVHIFLDNACKYTPSGGTLFLSLSRSSGIVRLVVSNSGKPIPAESLPHLFDRFILGGQVRGLTQAAVGPEALATL